MSGTTTFSLADVANAVVGHSLEHGDRDRRSLPRRRADTLNLVHLTLVRTIGLLATTDGPVRVDLGNGHVMTCAVEKQP